MSKDVKIIPSEISHARHLADNLRDEDLMEIEYSCGADPHDAIVSSIKASDECYTVMIDDLPALIFGVRSYTVVSSNALIWMLSTDAILELGFRFIRHSKHVVNTLMGHRKRLYNYVWEDNSVSIKWLKWMGFNVVTNNPLIVQDETFYYFEMVK